MIGLYSNHKNSLCGVEITIKKTLFFFIILQFEYANEKRKVNNAEIIVVPIYVKIKCAIGKSMKYFINQYI